jgi:solute carrier family 25 2-oxodicarboxylate transporter 21
MQVGVGILPYRSAAQEARPTKRPTRHTSPGRRMCLGVFGCHRQVIFTRPATVSLHGYEANVPRRCFEIMPREDLDAHQLFVAGAYAGIAECLAVQPLDMVKTRFQLVASSHGVGAELVGIIREGGVLQLYRGVLPELAAITPKSSVMYLSYETACRFLRDCPTLKDSPLLHFVAGGISGIPEALAVTPFQVVKVRLQAKANLGLYRSTWHCISKVLAKEGAGAFATGLTVTIWRNSIWNAVYFSFLSTLRSCQFGGGGGRERSSSSSSSSSSDAWIGSGGNGTDGGHGGLGGSSDRAIGRGSAVVETLRTVAFGFVAGVAATCCNNPFDVVKSRLQAQAGGGGGSWVTMMRSIWQKEGLQGLYVGFTPKAMRMGVGGAVGMAAFEATATALYGHGR